MKGHEISISIPASLVSDVPSLLLKTYKIGQVARASAIYCVNEILIYPDHNHKRQQKEIAFISQILRYMDTPQYLRRRLFPLSPMLRYAGILPPLNTPHHPTENRMMALVNDEFRQGIVVASDGKGSLVDVGVEKPLRTLARIPVGEKRTYRVVRPSEGTIQLELADPPIHQVYWGYKVVELQETLGAFIKKRPFDLCVLTSRRGQLITEVLEETRLRLETSRKILIAFGSPREGLQEILAREGLDEKVGDLLINTVPGQGTMSVRTEEAVHGTLAIVNLLIRRN